MKIKGGAVAQSGAYLYVMEWINLIRIFGKLSESGLSGFKIFSGLFYLY